jgi:GR25 family glycosyltransferase involved in LPS biosynthesis
MIQLPNVTLICVATRDHELAFQALRNSMKDIDFGAVKLLSDKCFQDLLTTYLIPSFSTIDEWNKFIFYDLYKYVDTDYCLLIHPDGYVIHPEQWFDNFLQYDYIGAPWPESESFLTTDGEMIRVGNSVSIRSKRLLELPSKLGLVWEPHNGNTNEDTAICVHYRQHFIGAGMTFAPVELAVRFSQEIPIPEAESIAPFAFHEWKPAPPKFLPFNLSDVYASYINLDSRPDRNQHMIDELNRVSISAVRTRGLLPEEVKEFQPEDKWFVMQNRTPGAIGCHWSQVAVMEEAIRQNKHAWVMEDDLVYCNDIQCRLSIIKDFCDTHDWDIIWLGGTYHTEPTWHRSNNGQHTHPDLQMCKCDLNRDWEPTDNPHIVRTYGCWSTYSYIVNRARLPLILERLDNYVYMSMGIDWLMILQQPQLLTFAFNPGCVRQFNNQSNIGSGITDFDSFASLGNHWYKQNL